MATIIAGLLIRGISEAFKRRFEIIRSFQEVLSSCGMSSFVLAYSHDLQNREFFLDVSDKVIKAYLAFVNPSAIVSCYFDEIESNPVLLRYFSKFKQYHKVRDEIRRVRELTWWDQLSFQFLHTVASVWGLLEYLVKLIIYLVNPKMVTADFASAILTELGDRAKDPNVVVDFLNQKFNLEEMNWKAGLAEPHVWKAVNPFLDLDWAVIKTYIMLNYAYEKATEELESQLTTPAFLPYQLVRVYLDDKLKAVTSVDRFGYFKAEVPYEGENELKLDTFGLTKTIYLIEPVEAFLRNVKWYTPAYGDEIITWKDEDKRDWYKYTDPQGVKWDRIGWELAEFQPCVTGTYYDDVELFIRDEGAHLIVDVYGSGTGHDHYLIYKEEQVVKCPTHRKTFCHDEDPIIEQRVATLKIDKSTLDIVEVLLY